MAEEIIQLGEHNMELLNHLDQSIFDEKVTPARLAALLKEPNQILLVALLDGLVIGQVLAAIHRHPDKPTELYIDDLAVSETVQRRGIATRLLKRLFAIGVERGCEEVWVATEPDNQPARKFYASLNLSARTAVVFEGELPGAE